VYRINGRRIEISYLKSGKDGTSSLEVNDDVLCMVSGNNMDGFIITVWW